MELILIIISLSFLKFTLWEKGHFNNIYQKNSVSYYNSLLPWFCHVISHGDDGSGMTTILLFELTIASHQRMTVKKEYGSQGRPDVYTWWPHSGRLTREGRSQTIGWDPKTEVAPSFRHQKNEKKKLVVRQGSWQTEPKPVLQVEEDIKIFRIEEAIFFKPVLKIA